MSSAWLLPEHIADVLPAQARRVEELRRVWLDAAPEPLIFFKANTAHIAMLDSHQWAQMQPDIKGKDCEQLERQFQMFQMRQRQIAALLEAHGIEVNFDFCPDANTARETLQR